MVGIKEKTITVPMAVANWFFQHPPGERDSIDAVAQSRNGLAGPEEEELRSDKERNTSPIISVAEPH